MFEWELKVKITMYLITIHNLNCNFFLNFEMPLRPKPHFELAYEFLQLYNQNGKLH